MKKWPSLNVLTVIIMGCSLHLTGCGINDDTGEKLQASLTFYASFDENFNADYSKGDPQLYITPSWNERLENYEVASEHNEYVNIQDGEGRYGNALWIDNRNRPVFFFSGAENMPYEQQNWNATVSFWMRISPEDIPEGFSDPIQITSRRWNDGALFVDFTDVNPRIFRYAAFPDRLVWDPEERDWDDVPEEERMMFNIDEPPFSRDKWSHVAFVLRNFNTGNNDGQLDCYIDGEKIGTLGNHEQTFTWNPEEVGIWIGYNYRGFFDELSIFNKALSDSEIAYIYSMENGIREILKEH